MDKSIQAQGIGGCLGTHTIWMVAHAYPPSQAYGGNVVSVYCQGNNSIPVVWDQVHLSWIKGQGITAFGENILQLLAVSWE